MLYKDFAKIVKKTRIKRGYSQKEFASELGLTPSNYNKIENGKKEPDFSTLQVICILLCIDLTEVLELNKPRRAHIKLFD